MDAASSAQPAAEEGVPPDDAPAAPDADAQRAIATVTQLLAQQRELVALLSKGSPEDLAASATLAGVLSEAMRALEGELLDRASAGGLLPHALASDDGAASEPGGTPRAVAEAFPELSARLQEIVETLDARGDELKNTQRQALVAERIKLTSELESRENAAHLARLLASSALQSLVEALFAPEAGPSAAAAKRERMARKEPEVKLLVNAKQGRKQLASTIKECAERSSTIAPQGFECICTLVNGCMSAMVSEAAPVFDELVVCTIDGAGQPPRVCGHLDWRAIGRDDVTAEAPMGIELLCLPVAGRSPREQAAAAATAAAAAASGDAAAGPADAGSATASESGDAQQPMAAAAAAGDDDHEQYVIIRTLDDGTRQYGFCAPIRAAQEDAGGARVICVLSRHPWFSLFESVLTALVSAAEEEEPRDGVPAPVVSILDALWHVTASAFPMPGERFTVPFDLAVDAGREPLHLTRARDDDAPLCDADFTTLFTQMGVSGVLAIYSALLSERHVLFVSSSYGRLCSCVHAAIAMLYPFVWQHILVAILPESWLDYVTAPMPFVLGIDAGLLDRVLELPIEESLLIVKIDSGEIAEVVSSSAESEAAAAAAPSGLPASISSRMEKALGKSTNDLKRQRMEPSDFNKSVLNEVVDGMVALLGDYREHFKDSGDGDDDDDDGDDGDDGEGDKEPKPAAAAGGGGVGGGGEEIDALDIEGLIASFEGEPDSQAFLESLRGTQLFDHWCQERVALKAEGYPQQGLFEIKVSEHDSSNAAAHAQSRLSSVDVETARYIIDASLTLQCPTLNSSAGDPAAAAAAAAAAPPAGGLLLDEVRQHDLWKNSSLWQSIFEDKLAAESNLELLTLDAAAGGGGMGGGAGGGSSGKQAAPKAKVPTIGRRASMSVMLGRMGAGGVLSEKDAAHAAAIAAVQQAADADADARAKALKREAGQLSEKIVEHSETMMRFGLPLDLVERLSTKVAQSHQLSEERTEKDVKLKVHGMIPRFVHLQPITKEGWLEVERGGGGGGGGEQDWDVRWFRIRDTSLCIHESDTHVEPSSVFPCVACEVSEPKSKRKGKDHVFRINVESHAVTAHDANSGTASKHVALKLIVNAASAAEKDEWYKHLQFGGAFVPTIERHTLKGDAKAEAVEALASMSAVSMKLRTGAAAKVHAKASSSSSSSHQQQADRESARQLFDEVDDDGSGALDVSELQVLAQKLGLEHFSASDAEEAMAAIDDDNNGTIDFEEFFGWYGQFCASHGGHGHSGGGGGGGLKLTLSQFKSTFGKRKAEGAQAQQAQGSEDAERTDAPAATDATTDAAAESTGGTPPPAAAAAAAEEVEGDEAPAQKQEKQEKQDVSTDDAGGGKEEQAHVQFGGKGIFTAVTMRLDVNVEEGGGGGDGGGDGGVLLHMVQYKEGLGAGIVLQEWSPKITAGCTIGAPKKLRSAKGKNAAPTPHQLRLDLASGIADEKGHSKYIICVPTAEAAEEWKVALADVASSG